MGRQYSANQLECVGRLHWIQRQRAGKLEWWRVKGIVSESETGSHHKRQRIRVWRVESRCSRQVWKEKRRRVVGRASERKR